MSRSLVLELMLDVMVMASALYINIPGLAAQLVFGLSCVLTVSQSDRVLQNRQPIRLSVATVNQSDRSAVVTVQSTNQTVSRSTVNQSGRL